LKAWKESRGFEPGCKVASEFAPTGDGTLHVLVVDDNRFIADTLVLILKAKGFSTSVAYSAEDAIDLARAIRPDILLSDVIMGGMNGIELATVFSREYPCCRIVLCSGQVATADLLKTAEAQGHRFNILPKPIHPTDLLQRLRG
jgi:CheY-like chemotaxis protein